MAAGRATPSSPRRPHGIAVHNAWWRPPQARRGAAAPAVRRGVRASDGRAGGPRRRRRERRQGAAGRQLLLHHGGTRSLFDLPRAISQSSLHADHPTRCGICAARHLARAQEAVAGTSPKDVPRADANCIMRYEYAKLRGFIHAHYVATSDAAFIAVT
jgi:hypothetical protein